MELRKADAKKCKRSIAIEGESQIAWFLNDYKKTERPLIAAFPKETG